MVIHAIERLGSFLFGDIGDLGKYKPNLENLASTSVLAEQDSKSWRTISAPFSLLFDLVKDARNDALHQGAFARHLTVHSIELALRLEDALRSNEPAIVSDYMVRNPVCAELWQPISFIRQQMLANSFSFMPVKNRDGAWQLVSDRTLAVHLRTDPTLRKRRMSESLEVSGITLDDADTVLETAELAQAVKGLTNAPLLVYPEDDDGRLVGILAAFDLL